MPLEGHRIHSGNVLDYLAAHGSKATVPAKLDLAKQRVRVAEGKSFRMRPFAELTLAELRRAARAKGAGSSEASAKVPAEVKKWRAALAKAKLSQVGVSLQGGLLTFNARALRSRACSWSSLYSRTRTVRVSGIGPEMAKKVGTVLG